MEVSEMGICKERGSRRGEELSAREDGGQQRVAKEATVGFHLQTLVCLDSVEVALPRCRPGSAEPLTRALAPCLISLQKEWR